MWKAGMKTISGHYGIDLLSKNWDKLIADTKSLARGMFGAMETKFYSSLDVLQTNLCHN